MQTVDKKDITRSREALDSFIRDAKSCEDRDELHKKAVAAFTCLSDRPALIKRACEAFNSNKSQYKLASLGPDKSSEDFAILNPEAVATDVGNACKLTAVKKFASATYSPKFYTENTHMDASNTVSKTASAAITDPADYIELDTRPEMANVTISNVLDHQRDLMLKLAYAVDDAKRAEVMAREPVASEVRKLTKAAAGETLSIAREHYGELISNIYDCFPKDLPLKKFAAEPRVPNTPVFQKIADYAERSYVHASKHQLLKVAASDIAQTLRKLAGAYNLAKRASLNKQASGVITTAVGAAIAPSLREALDLEEGAKDKQYNKIMNPNVQNILRELETKRNFYEVYADDYVSTFPVDTVQVAYNNAIQKLPESLRKHPSSATQLVRSWVIKMLSRGSVTSAEDAADVLDSAEKLRNEGKPHNPYTVIK